MSRMRTVGLVVFTFFALLMLALTIGAVVEGVHGKWRGSFVDMIGGFVFAVALTAASGAGWFRQAARARNQRAGSPTPAPPRSKYAVWANRPHDPSGNPARCGAARTRKTLRPKR